MSDQKAEYRLLALRRIKALKANSESADIRNWDVSAIAAQLDQVSEQAPPPPPPPSLLDMTVTDGSGDPLRWQESSESIFALLRELAAAAMRQDRSLFERVLDDDYISAYPGGETKTKSEEIDDIMKRGPMIIKVEFDEVSVSEGDKEGVATFVAITHLRNNGQESVSRQRYSLGFKRSHGQLKITSRERR